MMRLVVSIGYPMEETIPAMMDHYGMNEKDARDLYSRVTERILSAEEQASTT